MTFAQLMELATTTATTVASISASMATTRETVTSLATSIASLVELNKASKVSILTIGVRIGDINRSVGTSIICLENAIRANELASKRFELDIPPQRATVGDIDTKVDAVHQDLDQHVDEVAALKLIVNSVWYGQLGAIREHIRRVESKSGADYTLVSDGVTRLKTMFFEALDKVNINVEDLLCAHSLPTTLPGALLAALRPSAGLPPNPEGALAPNNAPASPGLDVHGNGPPLAGHLGSGRATSTGHPLFPTSCDFDYNREAIMHGCLGPRLDAHPQGRNLTDTGCQGYGSTPRLQHQRQPEGGGFAYARLRQAHLPYSGTRDSRNAAAPPDHRRYDDDVDAEYGHNDEDSLLQGGAIISPCH